MIWWLFDPWIRDRFFPDPGSRIPNSYYWELVTIVLVNGTLIFCQLAKNFVGSCSKIKHFFNTTRSCIILKIEYSLFNASRQNTCMAKKEEQMCKKTLLQQTINIQIPVIHISPSPFSKIKPNIYMPKQVPYWVKLLHLLWRYKHFFLFLLVKREYIFLKIILINMNDNYFLCTDMCVNTELLFQFFQKRWREMFFEWQRRA